MRKGFPQLHFQSWRNYTLRVYDFLVILSVAFFFYGIVPVIGAFSVRRNWRKFRSRFDNLRLSSLLDYKLYQDAASKGKEFRFLGGLESVTDDQTLWVRNDDITIPVDMKNVSIYLLPNIEDRTMSFTSSKKSSPERIRFDSLSSLNEGAKVYIGGLLDMKNDRLTFLSTKEHPLLIIFYDGSRRNLSIRTIRAGRQRNEYWNILTPYSFAFGIFLELMYAFQFIARPAYQLTLITAIIAMFGPLFPLVPPGIIFTNIYSRLWRQARMFRSYRDVFKLPLKYLSPGKSQGFLPNGERYGFQKYDVCPPWIQEDDLSSLPPDLNIKKAKNWYVFGILPETRDSPLGTPNDPLVSLTAFPDDPRNLAHIYSKKARSGEIFAVIMFVLGIILNCLFISLILYIILLM